MAKLLIFLLLFTNFSFAQNKKLHEKCLFPTIMIDGDRNYGTGVVIKSIKYKKEYVNFFVSANHNFQKKQNYEAIVFKYENWSTIKTIEKYPILLISRLKKTDILIGSFLTKYKMAVADMDLNPKFYIGDQILSFGCALQDAPRLERGEITSVDKKKMRCSIHAVPGDSGGPIFKDYKFVGIIHAVKMFHGHIVFKICIFIPNNNIENLNLDKNLHKLTYYKLKFLNKYDDLPKDLP